MAKGIDWENIQVEYEETNKSVRQIATENGITHGAIQRRTKKEGWLRVDINDIIKDKALVGKKSILGPVARRKVKEIIEILGEHISPLDEPLIAIFAKSYETWIECQLELDQDGATAVSSKGGSYISAMKNVSKMEEKTLINLANQLGLSISARKRMGLNTKFDQQSNSLFDIGKEIGELKLDV